MAIILRRMLRGILLLLLFLLVVAGVLTTICLSSANHPVSQATPARIVRLQQHVDRLCEQARYGEDKQFARKYIAEQLKKAGWTVQLQYFTNSEGETHCNISALRPGKSPQRYIIGAHYDACDTGNSNPGADDNASAVAVLLELAHSLPQAPAQYGIELVAWDCEEPPYFDTEDMGSVNHAASCTPASVRAVICLEMLGYYSTEPGSQPELFPGHRLLLPTIGNFTAIIGDWNSLGLARTAFRALSSELPCVRLNIPFAQESALYFSDHRSYAAVNIPAIMITDTAMLRNPNYHTAEDLPSTLSFENIARNAQGVIRLARQLMNP